MFNGACCSRMDVAEQDKFVITNPDTGWGLCFSNGHTYIDLRYCPWCGADVQDLRVKPEED